MSSQLCTIIADSSLFFFRFLRPPRWRFSPPKKSFASSSTPSAVQSARVTFVAGFGVGPVALGEADSWLIALALGGITFCAGCFGLNFCVGI